MSRRVSSKVAPASCVVRRAGVSIRCGRAQPRQPKPRHVHGAFGADPARPGPYMPATRYTLLTSLPAHGVHGVGSPQWGGRRDTVGSDPRHFVSLLDATGSGSRRMLTPNPPLPPTPPPHHTHTHRAAHSGSQATHAKEGPQAYRTTTTRSRRITTTRSRRSTAPAAPSPPPPNHQHCSPPPPHQSLTFSRLLVRS